MNRSTHELHERAIRAHLGCSSRYAESVPVPSYERMVHIYRLAGHAEASRCYVFNTSEGIATILDVSPTDSPERAVTAALHARH